MGIRVQSVIKRLPIIVGPICGGVLIVFALALSRRADSVGHHDHARMAVIFLQRRIVEEKSDTPSRAPFLASCARLSPRAEPTALE